MTAAGLGLDSCRDDQILLGKAEFWWAVGVTGYGIWSGPRCVNISAPLLGRVRSAISPQGFLCNVAAAVAICSHYIPVMGEFLYDVTGTCLKTMQSVDDMRTAVDVEILWRSSEPSSVLYLRALTEWQLSTQDTSLIVA